MITILHTESPLAFELFLRLIQASTLGKEVECLWFEAILLICTAYHIANADSLDEEQLNITIQEDNLFEEQMEMLADCLDELIDSSDDSDDSEDDFSQTNNVNAESCANLARSKEIIKQFTKIGSLLHILK